MLCTQLKKCKLLLVLLIILLIFFSAVTWYAYNKCVLEDDNKADKTIKEFEKVAKTYPYPADTDNERILLKLIDERYIMQ